MFMHYEGTINQTDLQVLLFDLELQSHTQTAEVNNHFTKEVNTHNPFLEFKPGSCHGFSTKSVDLIFT